MRVATPTSLRIRQRQSADDPFISQLGARAFNEYDPDPRVTLQRVVQGGTTWVALKGGAPVGFAVVRRLTPSAADICAIAVEEDARGRGIGRALLAQVEQAAVGAGLKELRLHTAQANLSALELFLNWGFRVTERTSRYYRGVYEAVTLVKQLGSPRP